jgi:serine/threonine protein kinase
MPACLTLEQIEEYASGALSPEEQAAVEAHLERCPVCREQLERHRARDEFLTDVRRVYGASDSVREMPLDEVIPGYRVIEEIHRGGQGVVFKAVQLSTQRTVALKVILGGAIATPEAQKRFEREARLAASLRHPHIVVIHDRGVAGDNPFIVMDYVDGAPVTEYAAAQRLFIAARLRLFATVCEAVECAHQQGVIHRDLKPSNILVNEEGEPTIVDFGLARTVRPTGDASATAVSSPGQVLGSLPYLSPEQASGVPSQIDERTDIYALGVLLYELLTGRRERTSTRWASCCTNCSPGDAHRRWSSALLPQKRFPLHHRPGLCRRA